MIPQTPDIMQSPLCYEGDTRTIPTDTPLGTNQLSYKQGFPPITGINVDAGGIAPERQDFNAALKLLSIHAYFVQSGNKYKYSNLLDYEIGSTVLGSDNALYYCIQANGATSPNTVQDPTSSTGYWVELINSTGQLNVDLIPNGAITGTQIANTTITGTKLANDTITAAQIAANAITASELANNAVDTAAIAAGAVTDAKITSVAASKVSGLLNIAAPLPVDGTGTQLGLWKMIANVTGPYSLPVGGTWVYSMVADNNGAITGSASGIVSGGTQIVPIPLKLNGFIWRIQ